MFAPAAEAGDRTAGRVSGLPALLLLRWVLIVSTSYLVIFSRPLAEVTPLQALFVCAYLATNLLLGGLATRLRSAGVLESVIVLTDTVAITVAHLIAGPGMEGSFVLYFVVMFLTALTERIGLVVGATVLIAGAHLFTVGQFVGAEELIDSGYLLRVPFLFAVALLFGSLVQGARGRERRAVEGRARAARLEFLSTVIHDVKSPLHVIQSLTDLLLSPDRDSLTAAQTDLADRIRITARHLNLLASNLIDAERIEAGRLTLAPKETRLETILKTPLSLASTAAQLRGVSLSATLVPNLPTVLVDSVQTERVLSNLLANAIKYTAQGGHVEFAVSRCEGSVLVSVTDDGPGIPPDQLPLVFEKYHRAGVGGSMAGSGLGLFIVKAVVEAQGGDVALTSSVGRGTRVTVSFPVAQPHIAEEGSLSLASVAVPVAVT